MQEEDGDLSTINGPNTVGEALLAKTSNYWVHTVDEAVHQHVLDDQNTSQTTIPVMDWPTLNW